MVSCTVIVLWLALTSASEVQDSLHCEEYTVYRLGSDNLELRLYVICSLKIVCWLRGWLSNCFVAMVAKKETLGVIKAS